MPEVFADVGHCVDAVLRRTGSRVVLALPLGIGKPNPLVNEFYRRALRDPTLQLTIFTALSLLKPTAGSALAARLIEPLTERIFGSYVEPDYARAMAADQLPPNVRVIEFYLAPGAFLNSAQAQRNYLSANYTQVAREVLAHGVNVIAQLVAQRHVDGERQLSLGSNADVTLDLLPYIATERAAGRDILLIGETHAQMPFMGGAAQVDAARFDFLIDDPCYDYDLFCPPNPPLGTVEHLIGLHASSLVRDGGTLQVGIGEIGDALIYALLLRHQQNPVWRAARQALGPVIEAALLESQGGQTPFVRGLYACTEMFIDQLLELYRAGILSRRVYDYLPLQQALDSGQIGERFGAEVLGQLAQAGAGPTLTASEFAQLRHYGIFREEVEFDHGRMRVPAGKWLPADLSDAATRAALAPGVGRCLRNGQLLHAGFFLGPRAFYAALRELPDRERDQFAMRGVAFVNQLYGEDLPLRILQRRHARCINTTMMVTLLGAAVSDGLENGKVVSGVGGQYNFVAMAHALPDARSILCVRATRTHRGRTTSNIIWNYGHATIPRHLRDIVITEYGVADLRGRTDEQIIAALLQVSDSRFQNGLLAQARAAGKIAQHYRIPDAYRHNLPARLQDSLGALRTGGYFSEYPFGTDLTQDEIELARGLKYLEARTATPLARVQTLLAALLRGAPQPAQANALKRMGLASPDGLRERLEQRLLAFALKHSAP
jgi:acyl-CoA hydrolase